MRQDSEAKNCFFVHSGEDIRITFEAVNVPDTPLDDKQRVHAVDAGNALSKTGSASKRTVTCHLTASKPVGKSHTVIYECVFFTLSDPASAKYVIRASGDDGGPFRAAAASQLLPSGELWFTVE